MNRFWDLMEKSTIISGVLAVSVTGAVVYLAIAGQPVPEIVAALAGTIVGYFFGSKGTQAAYSRRAQ